MVVYFEVLEQKVDSEKKDIGGECPLEVDRLVCGFQGLVGVFLGRRCR